MASTKIDWKALEHAHGSAKDLPREIKELTSVDGANRARAFAFLERSLVADTKWFTAAAAAIPLLIELAGDSKVKERERVVAMLVDIVAGGHLALVGWGLDMREQDLKKNFARSPAKDVYAAMHEATDAFVSLLRDKSAKVRAAAAFALGFAWDAAQASQALLRRRLAAEKDPCATASVTLALGLVGRYLDDRTDEPRFANLAGDRERPDLVRGAAVLARLYVDDAPLSKDERAVCERVILLGDVGRSAFPWCYGRADKLVTRVLEVRLLGGNVVAAKLLAAAVVAAPTDPLARERVEGALTLVFERRDEPLLPSELSDVQRDVLGTLTHVPVEAGYVSFGLPERYRDRRRFLGIDPPGPLDARLTMKVKGKEQTAPLWRHMRTMLAEGSSGEAIFKRLEEELSPEDCLGAYAEATLNAYGTVAPWPNRLDEVIEKAGKKAEPWSARMIDELVADPAHERISAHSNIGNCALLPVVRKLKPGAHLEERLRPLVRPDGPPELTRAILGAMPAAERQDALLPALQKAADDSWEEGLAMALEAYEDAPTRPMAAFVLDLARRVADDPGTVDEGLAARAEKMTEKLAKTHPGVAAALAERRKKKG